MFFEQGLRKDDIAIIQLPNVVELPMVYLALSKLGIICSPIPMQYGAYEITSIIAAAMMLVISYAPYCIGMGEQIIPSFDKAR